MAIECLGRVCPTLRPSEELEIVFESVPRVQEAETSLDIMLRKERLSSSTSPLIRESFLQSVQEDAQSRGQFDNADASLSEQLKICRGQLQRRSFLMKHCSAETRLALAACDWAAEKSQASFASPPKTE